MQLIPKAESSTSFNKKNLLISGAAVSIVSMFKFKKYFKNIFNFAMNKSKQPFAPVNQSRKILHQCCGDWKNPRHLSFDRNEKILISNPQVLMQKLQEMKNDGLKQLQICTDFDQTITAFGCQTKPHPATFGVIRESKYASEEFKNTLRSLFIKYHPYERDLTISQEQKAIYMAQWNQGVQEAYSKECMSKNNILKALEDSKLSFRYHYKHFLRSIADVNLPCYVISGGFGPLVQTMLNSVVNTNKNYPNFFLFSNEGIFNDNDVLHSIEMLVNVCTKEEKVNSKDFNLRKNTILLGDYPHDIFMQNQLESKNVVSILFLRDSMKDDINQLQKEWDIIIRGDGSYILPHAITGYIAGSDYCELQLSGDSELEFKNNPIYAQIKQFMQ